MRREQIISVDKETWERTQRLTMELERQLNTLNRENQGLKNELAAYKSTVDTAVDLLVEVLRDR